MPYTFCANAVVTYKVSLILWLNIPDTRYLGIYSVLVSKLIYT